ncbi:putative disease resistance RPP13-like protein 1 isoform X1 [Typha angustifolia]|uniref:putative disease resistance RPP13-like protein 1 isoform X1 n=2 Tax=Typha angustifolia TaxID=59011 RepID=UPI003C2BD32B
MAEVAILAGLGWVLSPIFAKVINEGFSYFGTNMADKLKDLETTILPLFELMLEKAEKSQQKDKVVMWLSELKRAIYEAEDVLDEVDYKRIQKLVEKKVSEKDEPPKNGSLSLIKKIKLKSVLAKLEDASTKAKGTIRELLDVHITKDKNIISMVPLNTVLGRDTDRRNIIEKLRKPVSDGGCTALTSLPVVAIFGRAGIGKTTLAQYVCEHEKAGDHFSRIMWVNVSHPFRAFPAMKKIMEFVSSTECFDHYGHIHATTCTTMATPSDLNSLQAKLQKKLAAGNFLLVLDGVWWDKDRIDEWELLFRCLEVGKSGSKILITTQEIKAAQAFGAIGDNFYKLQEIEEDEFIKHFMRYALPALSSDSSPWDRKEFEETGKKIAQKLKRDPAAAKRVGMQLHQKGVEYWREVSENDWLDETLIAPMQSFQRLPAHVQRCFSFCSIYPKGFEFKQSYLISLWIAEGFIIKPLNSSEQTVDMVDIGKAYLDDLVSMSYFRVSKVDKDGMYYVMHESLHDFAERVSKGECFRVEKDCKEIPPTVHHLSIRVNEVAEHKESICRLKNLRTLIFMEDLEGKSANGLLEELLKELRKLRVLSLSFREEAKFLGVLGGLKHLRFLNLGETPVQKTNSFSTLYHLQVLSFTFTQQGQHLSSICNDLGNLINLRVLDITVKAGTSVKKQVGHKIGQLRRMKELRVLSIKWLENIKAQEMAMEAKLKEMKHLDYLGLECPSNEKEDALEGFEPPADIAELTVVSYQGSTCPTWMNGGSHFRCIKCLTLSDCGMEELPSLKELIPRCQTLRLEHLPNLRRLPKLPTNLTRLVIGNCPVLVVKEDLQHVSPLPLPTALRELTIKACNITNEALSSCLQELRALTYLHLVDVRSMTTLPPEDVLSYLTGLRHLHIESCSHLESFGGFGVLSSLKQLKIRRCHSLLLDRLVNSSSRMDEGSVHELQLISLSVEDSPDSTSLPARHLTSLVNLEVKHCPKLVSLLSSLHKLTVDDSVQLAKLLSREGLASLKELTIKNSKEKSFADDGFSHLSSLRSLQIQDCTDLESLPHLPESLERLELVNCSAELQQRCGEGVGFDWPKIKHIPIRKFIQLPEPSDDGERKKRKGHEEEEEEEEGKRGRKRRKK